MSFLFQKILFTINWFRTFREYRKEMCEEFELLMDEEYQENGADINPYHNFVKKQSKINF